DLALPACIRRAPKQSAAPWLRLKWNHAHSNTRRRSRWHRRTSGPERTLSHSTDASPNDRQPTARVAHTSSRKSWRSEADRLVSSVAPFLSVGKLGAIEFEHEKPKGR